MLRLPQVLMLLLMMLLLLLLSLLLPLQLLPPLLLSLQLLPLLLLLPPLMLLPLLLPSQLPLLPPHRLAALAQTGLPSGGAARCVSHRVLSESYSAKLRAREGVTCARARADESTWMCVWGGGVSVCGVPPGISCLPESVVEGKGAEACVE